MSKREAAPVLETPAVADAPDVLGQKFLAVELDRLVPNPLNPKSRLAADPELVASIRDRGLLQPIVARARDDGRFDILAGHRRFAALRELDWKRAPSLVIETAKGDDGGLVLLAENHARLDLKPLEEAAVVARLLKQGLTHVAIGAAVGKSIAWVARRANMGNLSPAVQKAIADADEDLAQWPPLWLEELALLDPRAQDELLGLTKARRESNLRGGLRYVRSLDELRDRVARELRPLRLAKWDLKDAQLVRAVGSCSACPKTSAAQPALFGLEAAPAELGQALCRDALCWNGKLAEWLKGKVKVARETHGRGLRFAEDPKHRNGRQGDEQSVRSLLGHETEVASSYGLEVAPKDKGEAVICADGPRMGDVIFVRKGKSSDGNGAAAHAPTLEDRRGALDRKRGREVLRELEEHVRATMLDDVVPPAGVLHDAKHPALLVAALLAHVAYVHADLSPYGGGVLGRGDHEGEKLYRRAVDGAKGFPRSELAVAQALWAGLREDLASLVGARVHGSANPGETKGLEWVAEWTAFDLPAALAAAAGRNPAPASWTKKGAKKGAVKKGAAK